jgi:hypothetical protein
MYMSAMPSHFGRIVPGGEGLPLFGWSRITGDLHVSHFFGIHALQTIPIFGLVAARVLSAPAGRIAVLVFTALYIGLFIATHRGHRGLPHSAELEHLSARLESQRIALSMGSVCRQ